MLAKKACPSVETLQKLRSHNPRLWVHLAALPAPGALQSVLAWQMSRDIFARQKRPVLPRQKRIKQPHPRATTATVTEP